MCEPLRQKEGYLRLGTFFPLEALVELVLRVLLVSGGGGRRLPVQLCGRIRLCQLQLHRLHLLATILLPLYRLG